MLDDQLADKRFVRVIGCQRDRAEALEERLVVGVAAGIQRRAEVAEYGRLAHVTRRSVLVYEMKEGVLDALPESVIELRSKSRDDAGHESEKEWDHGIVSRIFYTG